MDGKKLTLFSCCALILLNLLLPIQAGAAENKVITPILSLLLSGGTDIGDTCTSGAQTVEYAGHEWQRCDDGHTYNLDQANTYCANLHLGGHSDWRLPAKTELKSLVVCTNGTPTPLNDYPNYPWHCGDGNSAPYVTPTIDTQFSCKTTGYWSSSVSGEDLAWYTHFNDGNTYWYYRTYLNYVRCVR